jgi:hypothetical protein
LKYVIRKCKRVTFNPNLGGWGGVYDF